MTYVIHVYRRHRPRRQLNFIVAGGSKNDSLSARLSRPENSDEIDGVSLRRRQVAMTYVNHVCHGYVSRRQLHLIAAVHRKLGTSAQTYT